MTKKSIQNSLEFQSLVVYCLLFFCATFALVPSLMYRHCFLYNSVWPPLLLLLLTELAGAVSGAAVVGAVIAV